MLIILEIPEKMRSKIKNLSCKGHDFNHLHLNTLIHGSVSEVNIVVWICVETVEIIKYI